MKIDRKEPPRRYQVGRVQISDCATIRLEPDEQVTFVTSSGKEHDFTAKSWGFYATPSVNARLVKQGFKTALVNNPQDKMFVVIVDPERMDEFEAYLRQEQGQVIEWLDQRFRLPT
ncbi:MAG: hypothetical protein FJ398_01620 [Verrucomicrobia bacterium]|nr:hypothetical protein [Verrucomicrobiota bacterium]